MYRYCSSHGLNLSVLTVGELSVLYDTFEEYMRKTTRTWGWPVLDTPVTDSVWRFLLAVSSELAARQIEEDAPYLPDWMEGEIPEWVLDVDGAGVTGYVTNHSNVPY